MPTYSYKVRNQTGEIISGVIIHDRCGCRAAFFQRIYPYKIEAEEEVKSTFEQGWQIFDRIKDEDLIVFQPAACNPCHCGDILYQEPGDTLSEQTKEQKAPQDNRRSKKRSGEGKFFFRCSGKIPEGILYALYQHDKSR